jgi:hypothetical protein
MEPLEFFYLPTFLPATFSADTASPRAGAELQSAHQLQVDALRQPGEQHRPVAHDPGDLRSTHSYRSIPAANASGSVTPPSNFSRVLKQTSVMSPLQFVTRETDHARPATHPCRNGCGATAGLSNQAQPDRDRPRRRLQEPEPLRAGLSAHGGCYADAVSERAVVALSFTTTQLIFVL